MSTDLTLLRAMFTVLAFATFIGVVLWTYTRANQAGFDEAAALPFDDGAQPAPARAGDAHE